ncbi:MAG TPA: molybdopterin-synthase adenylyltransferase MoeB [Candidatus Dormibacteraeota bacterium]|nr:molybdopterin-synthase adenylyltransferase MoeB [Candidatus Dormibacteraeota bacterium]
MGLSSRELVDQARHEVPEVAPQELQARLAHDGAPQLLDVREPEEVAQGVLPEAVHIPRGFLELRVESAIPDRLTPITVYCASGVRSLLAAQTLRAMGYSDVISLRGGFNAWKDQGLPYTVPHAFTAEQRERYSRHFLLTEVGEAGQAKLLDAKVLLLGAGGLGAPVAYYLAAAGVGTIGLVDFDRVELSNLQRQIVHTVDRLGMLKTESAAIALKALNPDVRVVEHNLHLDSSNAAELFSQYDVIVNGSDNFPTRYLANDIAIFLRKPLVDGGIFRFEGQVTTMIPFESACYRCRYPAPPPPEEAPSCSEAGVLGVLPGLVGMIQATEVVKLILGIGETLSGRLLHVDALAMEFNTFRLRRDPECPVCGERPTITEPIDYEGFCLNPHLTAPAPAFA